MKKKLCFILFFLASFVYAKPSQEVIEEKDWSWLKDENLVKEKKKQSEELMDKYLYDYSQENISITIQKCLFKKNTIKIKYKNISTKDLHILKSAISTNDESCFINCCYKIFNPENEKAEYIGSRVALTLGYVEEADFTLIKVGQTIKNEIDLSKFFKLSKDEIYTVQFKYSGLSSNIITINN